MNPLNDIMDRYRMAKVNHKMVVRLLEKDPSLFPPDSPYLSKPLSSVKKELEKTLNEIEDLTVISLFFLFEKIILDHLVNKANNIKTQYTDALSNKIINYGLKEPDRWKLQDVLDLYKINVASDLVGHVKQILQYRN